MATLDAPILPAITSLTGAEYLVTVKNGVEGRLQVNGLHGLLSGDVDSSVANGETIATRLAVLSGTTPTVTLPSAAGSLREVIVLNGASGTATLDTPGSEKIYTATADADTLTIATGKSVWLLSNGTKWFHASNDS